MSHPDASAHTADSPRDAELSARYVYCVTPSLASETFSCTGIEGRPVYPISHGGLSALVHDCRPQPYQGDDETVKRWVAAHAAVVDAAWAVTGSILPMSFDAIVEPRGDRTADDNVRSWLAENENGFIAKLKEFRDKVELGVHVLWDPAEVAQRIGAASDEVNRLKQEMAGKPEGVAYFHRQKIAKAVRGLLEAKADADYRTYYQRITVHADEVAVNKPTAVEGKQALLSLSILVEKAKVSALGQELAAIGAQEGLSVRFTGPWPPYTFAAKIAVLRQP